MDKKGKRKGGAEKIRLKKQKLLEISGQQCVKLTNIFKCPTSSTSTSDTAVAVTSEALTEVEINVKDSFHSQDDRELLGIGQQIDDRIDRYPYPCP